MAKDEPAGLEGGAAHTVADQMCDVSHGAGVDVALRFTGHKVISVE
jgi:hypothetical protein